MNDYPDLGKCCACEGTENVRNIIMLDLTAPIPGTGWGCFVCHKPYDGAVAVLCDRCLEEKAKIIWVVYGMPTDKQRVMVTLLTKPFEHDMRFHQDEIIFADVDPRPDEIEED